MIIFTQTKDEFACFAADFFSKSYNNLYLAVASKYLGLARR